MIDTRLLNEIKQHAMDCYPNEACGFIVVNKYKLALTIKCRNDSPFPKLSFLLIPMSIFAQNRKVKLLVYGIRIPMAIRSQPNLIWPAVK